MYLAFASSAFQSQLAYRSQVWANIFGRLIQVSAWIAIWQSVYVGAAGIEGVTLADMTSYAVLGSIVTTAWDWRRLLNTVGDSISSGDVAVFLLKPLRYPLYLFATECGNLGYKLSAIAVPVIVVVALVYGVKLPASLFHGLLFVPFFVLSFLIMFLLALLCGLLAFWLMTAFSIEWLLQGILTLLSGSALPLWIFPAEVGRVVMCLPFAWISYHPAAVYLGKVDVTETWVYLSLGVGWAAILALAVAWLWRRAALRITVQGG